MSEYTVTCRACQFTDSDADYDTAVDNALAHNRETGHLPILREGTDD